MAEGAEEKTAEEDFFEDWGEGGDDEEEYGGLVLEGLVVKEVLFAEAGDGELIFFFDGDNDQSDEDVKEVGGEGFGEDCFEREWVEGEVGKFEAVFFVSEDSEWNEED